jgi:hypothetical protein
MSIPNNLPGSPLTDPDFEKLAASGIDRQLAEQARLRRVFSLEGAEVMGDCQNKRNYAGILYPNFFPGDQRPREYVLRRDHPEIKIRADGTKHEEGKYLQPPGRSSLLYFPPGIDPEWLADPKIPVVITEGPKKTLALHGLACHNLPIGETRPRWLTVGVAGVWNFRGTIGKTTGADGERCDEKGVIPDFQRFNWVVRIVTIAFDANVRTNRRVRAARRDLTIELRQLEAQVFWVAPPDEPGVNGFDDLIGLWLIFYTMPAEVVQFQ